MGDVWWESTLRVEEENSHKISVEDGDVEEEMDS